MAGTQEGQAETQHNSVSIAATCPRWNVLRSQPSLQTFQGRSVSALLFLGGFFLPFFNAITLLYGLWEGPGGGGEGTVLRLGRRPPRGMEFPEHPLPPSRPSRPVAALPWGGGSPHLAPPQRGRAGRSPRFPRGAAPSAGRAGSSSTAASAPTATCTGGNKK